MAFVSQEKTGPSRDAALRARAQRVVPGGMWGHMHTRSLPAAYPQFFAAADGARLQDVDGREYIDFMCSYGPMILGYGDAEVEAAAAEQKTSMDLANGPAEAMVDLAELMVETIPAADWAIFSKNGTDATTACVMIARAQTDRRKILVARRAYHGAAPWCTPWPAGTTVEDRVHQIPYEFNDAASLRAAAEEAGGDLAGVLVSAFRHDGGRDQEAPCPEFAAAAREVADAEAAALILDDVRAGFRLDLRGSWAPLGVQPDLSAWSKALGNGYPIAAVTGGEAWREAATRIFVTGSFWCSAVPMAAAAATLRKLHRIDGPTRMARLGERLRDGVAAQAARHGVGVRQSGPPQMPLILFEDDPDRVKGDLFAATALDHGVYMHPWHNMFLSTAHEEADIDAALQATDAALTAVARRFG